MTVAGSAPVAGSTPGSLLGLPYDEVISASTTDSPSGQSVPSPSCVVVLIRTPSSIRQPGASPRTASLGRGSWRGQSSPCSCRQGTRDRNGRAVPGEPGEYRRSTSRRSTSPPMLASSPVICRRRNVRTCSRPSGLLITMMVGITSGRRSRVTPGSRAMAGTTAMSASSCWSKRGMPLTRSRISRP